MNVIISYRRTNRLTMRLLKNGDLRVTAPLGMSQSEIRKFLTDHSEWIQQAIARTAENEDKRMAFFNQLPLRTKAEAEAAYRRLQALIPPMVEKYAGIMQVHPGRITYKAMISQWGRCNVKTRELCFSAYLLLLPEWCVEHVVVHELAHLKVPGHGPAFHAVMDTYYPQWRAARKETLRISRLEA